jgi:hypothetical protein
VRIRSHRVVLNGVARGTSAAVVSQQVMQAAGADRHDRRPVTLPVAGNTAGDWSAVALAPTLLLNVTFDFGRLVGAGML